MKYHLFYTKCKVTNIFISPYQNISSLRIVWVLQYHVHYISWKNLSYDTRWRPILQAISSSAHLHATSPLIHIVVFTYIGLVQPHSEINFLRDMQQSASCTCLTHCLAYLLEEHAILCCTELYLRSINVIDHHVKT